MADADVMFLHDPAIAFDGPAYRRFGNMFWSDIYHEGMNKDEAFEYVGVWACWACLCLSAAAPFLGSDHLGGVPAAACASLSSPAPGVEWDAFRKGHSIVAAW